MGAGWIQGKVNGKKMYSLVVSDDSKVDIVECLTITPDSEESGGALRIFARVDNMPWWKLHGVRNLNHALDLFIICKDEPDFYRLKDLAQGELAE